MVPSMGRFDDVPLKKDNPPAPEWVVEGVVVVHDTFGRGVVCHVGLYKRLHTVHIEFDKVGLKALSPKYGMAYMRRQNRTLRQSTLCHVLRPDMGHGSTRS